MSPSSGAAHLVGMRFTEHEMTVALTTIVRKRALDPLGVDVTDPSAVEAAWTQIPPMERFHLLDNVGALLYPVLPNLPDITVTPGQAISFDHDVVRAAVVQAYEARVAADKAERLEGDRLDSLINGWANLTVRFIAAMPVRVDPNGLLAVADLDIVVPDTLEGL